MEGKKEMVKVEIEVPDGIIAFLKDIAGLSDEEITERIGEFVQEEFGSEWNAFEGDISTFIDKGRMIQKYELASTETLRKYIKDC